MLFTDFERATPFSGLATGSCVFTSAPSFGPCAQDSVKFLSLTEAGASSLDDFSEEDDASEDADDPSDEDDEDDDDEDDDAEDDDDGEDDDGDEDVDDEDSEPVEPDKPRLSNATEILAVIAGAADLLALRLSFGFSSLLLDSFFMALFIAFPFRHFTAVVAPIPLRPSSSDSEVDSSLTVPFLVFLASPVISLSALLMLSLLLLLSLPLRLLLSLLLSLLLLLLLLLISPLPSAEPPLLVRRLLRPTQSLATQGTGCDLSSFSNAVNVLENVASRRTLISDSISAFSESQSLAMTALQGHDGANRIR
jgi:hypothetical protein